MDPDQSPSHIPKIKFREKLGFLGFGNMSSAMARCYFESGLVKPENILASNRTERKLTKARDEWGIQTYKNNEELVENSDVIFVSVKPQDILEVLEPLGTAFSEDQVVISLAAGMPIHRIEKVISSTSKVVRIMPNTPVEIGKAMVGYCLGRGASSVESLVLRLMEPLGEAVAVTEGDQFEALTVSCASGIAFVYEIMQYWQEWIEEHGYSKEDARKMAVQTFLGGALLAEKAEKISLIELRDKVVSKKGVAHSGLESMRELEIDRALRYSFEKAALRDRELGGQN